MDRERLDYLLSRYGDEAITADERLELEQMLADDDDACRRFWAQVYFDAEISLAVGYGEACLPISIANSAATPATHEPVHRMVSLIRSEPLISSFVALVALVLVLATLGYLKFSEPNRPEIARVAPARRVAAHVAWLSGSHQAKWAGDVPIGEAPVFLPGRTLQLVSGLAEITFGDGAIVILQSPASLTVHEAGRAELMQGRLTAQVEPRAVGFTVQTPRATIVDFGTEFGVSADPTAGTEVVVYLGVVELTAAAGDGGRTLRLGAGQAGAVKDGAAVARRVENVEQTYVRTIPKPTTYVMGTMSRVTAYDSAKGFVFIFGQLADQSGRAHLISFVGDHPDRWLTPLLLSADSQTGGYRVSGIGAALKSDGSGLQSARFRLVAGSEKIEAGRHTFGYVDAAITPIAEGKCRVRSRNTGTVGHTLVGPWHYAGAAPGDLSPGQMIMPTAESLRSAGRTYSIQMEIVPTPSSEPMSSTGSSSAAPAPGERKVSP